MTVAGILPRFEIIGHRGNPGNPLNSLNIENTTESFNSAWALDADGIELDVILTKDDQLFVHHDDSFGRVYEFPSTPAGQLIKNTYSTAIMWGTKLRNDLLDKEAERRSVKPGDKDRIEEIATLNIPPFLDEVSLPKGKKLFLELKFVDDKYDKDSINDQKYLKDIAKKAVKFIEFNKLVNKVYVLSFVPEVLDEIRTLNSDIITAYNVYRHESSSSEKIRQAKKDFGFTVMNPPFEQATREAINNMRSEGLETYPWVWNQNPQEELGETKRLITDGANGSINNQVEAALKIRNKYAVRSI